MSLLSFLFGTPVLKKLIREGAVIIDVRSPSEYDRGHIPDAFHIPVDRIVISIERIRAIKRPIIICCSDGDRSRQAIRLLKRNGINNVYYGGNWERLWNKIR